MEGRIRVCLVEDDYEDYIVTRDLLGDSRETRFELEWASSYEEGLEALRRGGYDVYLIDYQLGAHSGLELLHAFAGASVPMIVLTGLEDREIDLEAMRSGAMDYLVKGQTNTQLLERSIRYSIARKRTEESLRHKDEFLAMLAHELRNPLAPVRTALHILEMPQADPKTLHHAKEVLDRQVNHLVRLVDDLLDVSRIVFRRIELRKEPTDLTETVRHAIETAEPVIEARGQHIEIVAPDHGVFVMGDPVRLAQAVTNLLVNAANHTEQPGKIRVAIERSDGGAAIRVRDWGIGIPKELLPSIFNLFVQGKRSLARSQGGLGIGLSLVKGIVELHGGTVAASSEGQGRGSEFTIHLPLLAGHPKEAPDSRPALLPGVSRRVLVVDDNIDAAETVAMMLEMSGHEVEMAHDGFSAVDKAKKERPDVVLLDIGLPGRDGYEVARLLRADADLAGTRIIALSGYGQREDQERSKAAGMDLHLTKPVDPDTLDRVIQE